MMKQGLHLMFFFWNTLMHAIRLCLRQAKSYLFLEHALIDDFFTTIKSSPYKHDLYIFIIYLYELINNATCN